MKEELKKPHRTLRHIVPVLQSKEDSDRSSRLLWAEPLGTPKGEHEGEIKGKQSLKNINYLYITISNFKVRITCESGTTSVLRYFRKHDLSFNIE